MGPGRKKTALRSARVLLDAGWLLGHFDYPGDERLNTLVRHEDDPLSGDNSAQPGHDTLVQALNALGLDDLGDAGARECRVGNCKNNKVS